MLFFPGNSYLVSTPANSRHSDTWLSLASKDITVQVMACGGARVVLAPTAKHEDFYEIVLGDDDNTMTKVYIMLTL